MILTVKSDRNQSPGLTCSLFREVRWWRPVSLGRRLPVDDLFVVVTATSYSRPSTMAPYRLHIFSFFLWWWWCGDGDSGGGDDDDNDDDDDDDEAYLLVKIYIFYLTRDHYLPAKYCYYFSLFPSCKSIYDCTFIFAHIMDFRVGLYSNIFDMSKYMHNIIMNVFDYSLSKYYFVNPSFTIDLFFT